MGMTLLSFHNDPRIKEKYLNRVHQHFLADEIIRGNGKYWQNGKGCAVGCTLHSAIHRSYETELGIPEWLAMLEDTIFEGLPLERARLWPGQFLQAIPIGADLEPVKRLFLIFVLNSTLNKFDHKKFPDVKKAIDTVIHLWETNETDLEKFLAAEKAAARKAVGAARAARAAWAGAGAAAAGAGVGVGVAWAAGAGAAAAGEEENEYIKFADKLLEILKEAK